MCLKFREILIWPAVVSDHDGAGQRKIMAASTTVRMGLNFEGLSRGNSPNLFSPPDTNGAVGATQVVEWVNVEFAVFNKRNGRRIKGPVAGNQLFKALGRKHPCAANNDGDVIAQYDKLNRRWVLSQMSDTNGPPLCRFQG